ncbi:hypothetical protein [Sinomonas sp. G460-2]|uniref:hypothetical protein n=1 Tax=Sinomonas sp. G460-2 TaxID=3393464 RepID=UPI0039F0587E
MTEVTSFEGVLSDVQSELIGVSLEYAGTGVSDVYAHGSIEHNTVQFDPFFVIDGRVIERHNLPGVDTSGLRQRSLLQNGAGQLQRLRSAGETFGRPVPTQLKLHYVVASGSLDATYKYEAQYSNDPSVTTEDLVDQWQVEVQKQLGQS